MHSPTLLLLTTLAWTAQVLGVPTAARKPLLAPLPAGSPNGFYAGTLNADGSTTWEYLGEAPNMTTVNVEPESLNKRGDGINCNSGQYIDPTDRQNAVNGFSTMCGGGLSYSTSAITYQSGSAIAYGCNYQSSQTCTSSQTSSEFSSVSAQCGNTVAGWYSVEADNYSYGYTPAGSGYC